jgi:hypothetical protein
VQRFDDNYFPIFAGKPICEPKDDHLNGPCPVNIVRNLERSAFLFPDLPVVSEGLSEISYAQLNK